MERNAEFSSRFRKRRRGSTCAPEATSPATTPLINTMLEVEGLANSVYPLHLLSQVPGIGSSAEDIKE